VSFVAFYLGIPDGAGFDRRFRRLHRFPPDYLRNLCNLWTP
jgi:hypothetical protein